ncbi:MAG: complex I subunit 5 family protein [Candidatus Izemoplasmatales bacterium]
MKCLKQGNQPCDNACDAVRNKFWDNFTFQSSFLVFLALLALSFFIFGVVQDQTGVLYLFRNIPFMYRALESFGQQPWIVLLIIFSPLVGGGMQLVLCRGSCHRRDILVIIMSLIAIFLVLLTYPLARAGGEIFTIDGVFMLGLSFRIDMLSFTMLLITSIIWFLVMVYAHEYMKKEKKSNRFFLFMSMTYMSVLGAMTAGDLLTLFLSLEIMTISSYILVVHVQEEESYSAGYNFIIMGLIGGFSILIALLLMQHHVGDLSFSSGIASLAGMGPVKYWIFGLLTMGFGIKAGMAPLHVWLPRAHPVAPTPASALLSGIMIKVGAYGILRIAISYYFPPKGGLDPELLWAIAEPIGTAIIWLGIVTMAVGVFLALQQANIKKMLAYHSISQMGYILMGIGVALYLGPKGAMGYTGALYHIINHALFKSLLFMVSGVVFFHTRETDMYQLGGLWRKLPLTTVVCLIAALGISGMPLFNGFISKSILHHGIVEAYQYGDRMFFYAELIFIAISAGTVCSFIKLFYYVFLRKLPQRFQSIKATYNCLDTAIVAVAILIVAIGVFPRFILDYLIVPQLQNLAYDPTFITQHIIPLRFFTWTEFGNMGLIFGLGAVLFVIGTKLHLFHLKLPKWLKLEFLLFYPLNLLLRGVCRIMYGRKCPVDQNVMARMKVLHNEDVGLIERFIVMTDVLNRRFERSIIKSDALLYTLFITIVLIVMAIARWL